MAESWLRMLTEDDEKLARWAAPLQSPKTIIASNSELSMVERMGKKWGLYKAGGRSQPVSCVYCGRMTPRIKAVVVRKHYGIGDLRSIPGIDRRRVFLPHMKAYACISCAKHRGLI